MKIPKNEFNGFRKETFEFFSFLEKNNNKKFFDDHRQIYENYLVQPAKNLVTSLKPFFNQLNYSIRTEPKFDQTLMRISKDMRFHKTEPYRDYFLIHFGRFKMDSEFYVNLDKSGISYGIFLNNENGQNLFFKENLKIFSKEIKEIFTKYELNNFYNLMELKKNPTLVKKKFNAEKHFDFLLQRKYMLLEKNLSSNNKLCYSDKLIIELIKKFSRLYPLYCFGISPEPLKLLNDFEENLGIAF